jgi:hypothetical protein
VDLPFPITGTCAATPADATIGGTCNVDTSTLAVQPGAAFPAHDGKKVANVEFGQAFVNDGARTAWQAPIRTRCTRARGSTSRSLPRHRSV